jgi:hypothetical protein
MNTTPNTTPAPDLAARARIHAALEQTVSHGAIRFDDAITSVAASLGEDRTAVVAALDDLFALGSIVHSDDGRLRPTYRMHSS